jgi:protein-S-isoprenylcysteine O-methyltransferase Ste14
MNWLYILVSAGWLAFWAYWLTAALRAGTTAVNTVDRRSMVPAALVFAIIILSVFDLYKSGNNAITRNLLVGTTGAIIFYGGIFLAVWARHHLNSSWGMPASVSDKLRLVTSGPYRLIRHPIYTGINLAVLGSTLIFGWIWFIILAIGLTSAIYDSIKEEELLLNKSPKEYSGYKRQTKMFIPYLI